MRLGWVGLGWVGLGWVGLGWVGLGWVCCIVLRCVALRCIGVWSWLLEHALRCVVLHWASLGLDWLPLSAVSRVWSFLVWSSRVWSCFVFIFFSGLVFSCGISVEMRFASFVFAIVMGFSGA